MIAISFQVMDVVRFVTSIQDLHAVTLILLFVPIFAETESKLYQKKRATMETLRMVKAVSQIVQECWMDGSVQEDHFIIRIIVNYSVETAKKWQTKPVMMGTRLITLDAYRIVQALFLDMFALEVH